MEILTVLLVPAAFVYYSAGNRFSNLPTYRLSFLSGLLCGILLIFFDSVIMGLFPWNSANFLVQYTLILFSLLVIPFIAGPALLNVVFIAQPIDRILRTVPQLFGIFSFYLPYIIFYRLPVFDIWVVLMVPVLYVSFIFMVEFILKHYCSTLRYTPRFESVLFAQLPVLALIVILPVLVCLWYFCFPSFFYWIPSFVMVLFSVGIRIRKYF
ncbi:MAG TPA: hypothetical protein GXZ47_04575 [Treponema sp.]|nr:hypothetical protein [Treponema sp.]